MAISLNGTRVVSSITTGNTVTASTVQTTSGDTILVSVHQRNESISISLADDQTHSWTEIANVDNTRGQNGVSLWRTTSTHTGTINITATITGNTLPAGMIAQSLSGTDTTTNDGVEAVTSTGGPATDDDDMLFAVTTVTPQAWAVAAGTHRTNTTNLTLPGGETEIAINQTVSTGGNSIQMDLWYEGPVASPASTQLGALADLSTNRAWCMITVSVKPASAVTVPTQTHPATAQILQSGGFIGIVSR